MSITFNGHMPPQITPESVDLPWDEPSPRCSFVLSNRSAWPIVYVIKVQRSVLNFSTPFPAQGILPPGESAKINLKFELERMKDSGLDLSHGHRIHVDSWYISQEDALRSDSISLLSAIKKRTNNRREPDSSTYRVRYSYPTNTAGPSRQDTLPPLHQTFRQPSAPRSMSIPHSYKPHFATVSANPAINIIPPSRQQTLVSGSSHADSPVIPISMSQPTSTQEQIARYLAEAQAPSRKRSQSNSSSWTTVRNPAATYHSRPAMPIPTRRREDTSPTSSAAGSFISAREGNADPDDLSSDAMDIDGPQAFVEEPASLPSGNTRLHVTGFRELPFSEPTARNQSTWTRAGPYLTPNRGYADGLDGDWMNYLPVDQKYRGKAKKPQGQAFSCGGFSDVYRCDVRFDTPGAVSANKVAVKVLRPVGLGGCTPADALLRMINRTSREAHTWSSICHPNVVPLLGYTFTPVLSLISPWYEKGSLRGYTKANPDVNRLKLLLDIAKGLAYLHSQNPSVIHGDIKPENILINDNGDALLMDFGLAMVMEVDPWYTSSFYEGGSTRWMAPELLLNNKTTRSCGSDVYSYGGVAFEIMTSEPPHSDRSETEIYRAICDTQNPKQPFDDWAKYPDLPEKVKDIILKCWSRRLEKRPTMAMIEERLQRMSRV